MFGLTVRELLGLPLSSHGCDGTGKTMLFNYPQEVLLKTVTILGASLSVLGCLCIIGGWIVLSELRNVTVYKLVLCLSIADLLASITLIVDAATPVVRDGRCPDALCYALAACTQLFGLASLLWTASICHSIYSILRKATRHGYIDSISRNSFCWYHVLCWGLPAVTVAVIVGSGAVGGTGQQCWIHDRQQWARFVFFFLPLLIVESFNLTVYRVISRAMSQTLARDSVFNRIRRYLLVSIVCKGLSLINRSYSYFAPDRPIFLLYLISSIGTPLQGVGNALVFGDQRIFRALCRHLCSRQRHGPVYQRTNDAESGAPTGASEMEHLEIEQGGDENNALTNGNRSHV